MLDFYDIRVKEPRGRKEVYEIFPDFRVGRSKDLMVQGGDFYAIWDEAAGLWSRDKYEVQRLVDEELREFASKKQDEGLEVSVKYLGAFGNGMWKQFNAFLKNVTDNSHPLDTKVTFADTVVKRSDYVSRRLPYSLVDCDCPAYHELVGTLYAPEERRKFEWNMGAILDGAAKKIEKFLVFYGKGGTGKSTIMNIAFKLLGGLVPDGGYAATFNAKALVGNNNAFGTEAFKDNPLIAIQHDGDLSKIEDNSVLNSIISHENLRVNEKYKSTYDSKINAMLWLGTNKPVQISDSKSGLIRRLIDVNPTGVTFTPDKYFELINRIEWELGAIANHCLNVYRTLGKSFYSEYVPENMMLQTDAFHNFVNDHCDIFERQEFTSLRQAWELYKTYAEETELGYKLTRHKFRDRLKDFFDVFNDRETIDGVLVRSVFSKFNGKQFKRVVESASGPSKSLLILEETESILDEMFAGLPAQYSNVNGNPKLYWDDSERLIRGELMKPQPRQIVSTVLGDLDTTKLHFVKVPEHHIIIDFDLQENGKKSLELNLEEAAKFPPTYAELSKSGAGVHLHYTYDGDPSELSSVYSEGIEIKVYTGNSSLRRKLTKCNNLPVATISSGLPFKEKNTMQSEATLRSERGLRSLIIKSLRKEIPPHATKTSMDFIEHILKECKNKGLVYDVSDMLPQIVLFANGSKKNNDYCMKVAARLELVGADSSDIPAIEQQAMEEAEDDRIAFFDCEVYPNLFLICWKFDGGSTVVPMLNPTAEEVHRLFRLKLCGYNNRDYDNHILYAASMGASVEELYKLSQRIIVQKDPNAKFRNAYNLSWGDLYDMTSVKKTLKKWEIEYGIKHMEMDIPWDKPVPEEKIRQVIEYCTNDVNALEYVFHERHQDVIARQILSELSGLSINTPNRPHAAKIIFGEDREPQKKFVYTDLGEMFPGYKFDKFSTNEKSTYREEVVGEGGYVYAEPGIHENVALLDVASMHPTSIEQLNLFGPYTKNFSGLKNARLAIKHARIANQNGDFEAEDRYFEEAKREFSRRLAPHIEDIQLIQNPEERAKAAKNLEESLKLVINSVYGLTSATFPNPFKDPRNIDNIVAKRGALFMIDLKHYVQGLGFTVAHIKTDSIKIPDANEYIIEAVKKFGAQYGYEFEHEATYEKLFLENDAVYAAKDPKKGWTATGARFQHPYVFKTLFSGEPIKFSDICETKQVKKGAMWLRYDESEKLVGSDTDKHIGRSGLFVPIRVDNGVFSPATLVCHRDDLNPPRDSAVSGTKGFHWIEAETLRTFYGEAIDLTEIERLGEVASEGSSVSYVVDMAYFSQLAEDAYQAISKHADPEVFCS